MEAKPSDKPVSATFCLLLAAAFLLPRLMLISRASLSGDEAVFGLMALAIGRGEEYPLYCWGAHYASALISYIAVPVMAVLGVTDFAFKVATLPYGVVTTLLIYFSMRRDFGELNARLSALAFVFSPPTLMHYSVAAHGGYPETYFLGPALWSATLGALDRPTRPRFFLLGLLAGAIVSILWLGLPFILAAGPLLLTRASWRRRTAGAAAAGAGLGLLPFLVYNLWITPGATIMRLGGHSLGTADRSAIGAALLTRLTTFPEWLAESGRGLAHLFAPVGGLAGAILFLGAAIWGGVRLARAGNVWGRLTLGLLAATAIFNLAGGLTRDRHWSIILFAVIIGANGLPRRIARLLPALIIATGFISSYHAYTAARPDPDIAATVALLRSGRTAALIADYDLGYPIGFRSGVLVAAIAPPNPADRRPDWTERVRASRAPGVLLPPGAIAERFERRLLEAGVDFARHELSSRIFYRPEASGERIMTWIQESASAP